MKTLVFFILLFAINLFAQNTKTEFFSVESDEKEAIKLSDIHTEVEIKGAFSETTLDLAYFNQKEAGLQGLFKIQLPQGALVRDFALKINEQWHMGSLIEKHKARTTFEEIVRRGADPAVFAWKDGAEYQVRIFPFPGKGKRWIRVRYWQDLNEMKEQFSYLLPLPKGVTLDTFKLKFNVQADAMESIEIEKAFSNTAYVKALDKNSSTYGAIIDEKNFKSPGDFSIKIGHQKNSKAKTWTGFTAPKDDLATVAVRWFEDLPTKNRKLSKRTLVFLDTSRSVNTDNVKSLLEKIKKLTEPISKQSEISYYEFDVEVRKTNAFDIKKINFDGGTNLQAVMETIKNEQKVFQKELDVIVITDGVVTMQNSNEILKQSLPQVRLYILPTSKKFSETFAQAWAEKNKGAVLNNPETLFSDYTRSIWRFAGLAALEGAATEVYPEIDAAVDTSKGIGVYFRAKKNKRPTSCVAKFTDGEQTIEMKADLKDVKENPAAESLWAMKKLFDLIPQEEDYSKELASHATRYALVSPVTSYIVLETDVDYQRFNITKRAENPNTEMFFGANSPVEQSFRNEGASLGGGGGTEDAMASSESAAMEEAEAPAPVALTKQRTSDDRNELPQRKRVESIETQPGNEDLAGAISWQKAIYKYTESGWSLAKLQENYKKTNNENDKDAWYFVEMAVAFSNKGEKKEALRILSNLFETSEEDAKSLRTLGLLGCFQGQCDWAEKALEMAIALRPEEPQNYRDLAWFYVERGNFKKAYETISKIRGKKFHDRFPGMDALIEKESTWLEALAENKNAIDKLKFPASYSWITWNNDNNDVDFWIRENKESLVSYRRKTGVGELSSDFTRGYGPEVYYLNEKKVSPKYFVRYFSSDTTTASAAVVVKMTTIESFSNGKPHFSSRLVPLYESKKAIELN